MTSTNVSPRNKTTRNFTLGGALALAVADMLGCGGASATAAPTDAASSAPAVASSEAVAASNADLIHCYNVNVCKGHNDCKTAENACGGQGECKTHGFVGMPSKACADVGGEAKDEFKGEIASADLIHCYGVNVCKGHNDCKTPDNACGGQSACKGEGFVAAPEKACTDIGGKPGA